MKHITHYLLLLGLILFPFTLVSCGGDEAEEEDYEGPGSVFNPIEESIQANVNADVHELTGFIPESLTEWSITDTEIPFGCASDNEMPETWVYAYPSETHTTEGSTTSKQPKLAFGFNATGERRNAILTIKGCNASGQYVNYHVNVVQLPETRSGKALHLTLTNLMPVNFTFQVTSPDINFKQTPLELEFDNGLRVKPLNCTEHLATLRIDAPEPFQAKLKVHVGNEVYDYGITRVYQFSEGGEHFASGLTEERLMRVDLGKARFQIYNHMSLHDVRTQLYDDQFQPCDIHCFNTANQEMTDGAAQFTLRSRMSPDVYLGEIERLDWFESPVRQHLASAYLFKDGDKTISLNTGHCQRKTQRVALRRSTGRVYTLQENDTEYNFIYPRWVASDENGDKFYVDNYQPGGQATVIGTFTVPKDEYNPTDQIQISALPNITSARIVNWKAVNDMIYLNREQVWEKGYVRQIQKPYQPSYEEYGVSFSSKMVLCQWCHREMEGPDGHGYGRYRTDLKVSDPLSDEWFIYETWFDDHSTPVRREYKIYSSLDRTLFVPLIDSENKPDWKGYVMTTFRQVKPFDVSGQLMEEYQNPDLDEIDFPLPFIGNYTYYHNKSTGELFRQQLQPLGSLERVAKVPTDDYFAQLSEDGLILGYSEVTTQKVWILQLGNEGQSDLRYIEANPGAELFYCVPL